MIRSLSRLVALALMLLCLLVAAALRLPDLASIAPGVHYDEAANGILAAEIGLEGDRPIFITSYTGKEVLFFYLAGGLVRLIGTGHFTLRLLAAFLGLLTVAATYWLGRELLGDLGGAAGRLVPLLAAALLAVSFWHVLFSRLGFRAISQPLLQALTVAALWHGLRRGSWRWVAAGGLFLGLTAYTYLAARLFPVPLGLSLLLFLAVPAGRRAATWRLLALFLVVGPVVAAPLLYFFATHPETFWVRITQVAPGSGALPGLLESYGKALGMLFVEGDPYWRFNLPGRPLFGPIWGALLILGWLAAVAGALRASSVRQQAAYLLLALAPPFMLLPTALAVGEILPSNLRAIGLIPFVFYLPPLGLVAVGQIVARRRIHSASSMENMFKHVSYFRPGIHSWPRLASMGVVFLVLALGGIMTYQAYFESWAKRSDVFYETDADLVAVARFLDALPDGERTIYLAAQHYRHPTIALLSERYEEVKWLPGAEALVLPAGGQALTIYPHSSPAPDWAEAYLQDATTTAGPEGPDGEPTFIAYAVDGDMVRSNRFSGRETAEAAPTNDSFGDVVTLLDYEIGAARTGGDLLAMLFWRIDAQPEAAATLFVHLEDRWGTRWSQLEAAAYPSEQWTPGEMVIQRVRLPVPPGTPPGDYRLRLGFFEPATGQQLSLVDDGGRYAGSAAVIEGVAIAGGAPPAELPRPPHALDAQPLPGLRLLGYERGGGEVATGDSTDLALWWYASQPLPPLLTRIELMRPDNTGVILLDTQPVHNTLPFAAWATPQFLIDRLSPAIPLDLAVGAYRLQLRLLDAADETLLTADLGPLVVQETARRFEPPDFEHPLGATLGEEIALLGYSLEEMAEDQLRLTLVWQALAEPAEDYTVFVHLLHPNGVCCLWQADRFPQDDYATSRWLAGEVVVDEYTIPLPPDASPGNPFIELGLYIAENGRRLGVDLQGNPAQDAVILRPPELQIR